MRPTLLVLLFIAAQITMATSSSAHPRSRQHFNHWFPQMSAIFEWLIENECASEYQLYLEDQKMNAWNPLNHTTCASCAISPVASCLFNHVPALGQATMQAAGILLGVLPTILTFIGTSKVETGILSLRRPLLAFLISAGAPAVNPLRSFDYTSVSLILQSWEGRKVHSAPKTPWRRRLIVLAQYVVVLAAFANVVEVTRELAFWSVCSWSPETIYLPFFWAFGTLVLHFLGVSAVYQRVHLTNRKWPGYGRFSCSLLVSRLRLWLVQEFTLSSLRDHDLEELSLVPETYSFLFTNWCLSALAMCHIIFGTVVLSSMLFLSAADAAFVAFRFTASTMACRLVLTHELCGLQQIVKIPHGRIRSTKSNEMMRFELEPESREDFSLVRARPLHAFESPV